MSLDVELLEPKIRAILSAPGVDLNTISAKRVRKRLMEDDPTLTMEVVKDNKDDIDDLIGRVYAEVNEAEHGSEEEETKPNKRRTRDEEHEVDGDEDEEGEAAPKKKKAKKGQEKSDEKLARKLSNEINGRATRAGKGRSNGTSKKGRSKRSAKSATTVDSDDQGDDEEGGKKKKKRGGGGKGGFAKEYSLSEPLSALLQVDKLSRPQVVKGLWDYIKGNELQNPANKREIMCDTNLKAVFNVDKINMFQMNKVLGGHLHEPEAES